MTQSDPLPPPEDTPPPIVCILDECIPYELGSRLVALLKDSPLCPRVLNVVDEFGEETPDEIWTAAIRDNGWLPITADRGRTNYGRKLPLLLREQGIVHISLSANVHRLPVPEKTAAVAAVWSRAVHVWQNRIGCCHRLQMNNERTGFRLVQKP